MELRKNVSNPMLIGAIELMKAEDTPEHRNLFVGELMKAKLLAPAVLDPAPVADENGALRAAPDSRCLFPMLTAKDGRRFFMAFTDMPELQKLQDAEKNQTVAVSFAEYAAVLLRGDKGKQESKETENAPFGIVLNPFGANVVIPREMAAQLMVQLMAGKHKDAPAKEI